MGEAAEDFLEAVGQRIEVLQVQRGNRFAVLARELHRFLDRAFARSPADEQHTAFRRAVDLRHGQFLAELPQLVAALGVHLRMHLAGAGRDGRVRRAPSPVTTGYLPLATRVPGAMWRVMPSGAERSYGL